MLQAIFFDPKLVRRHELVGDEICARDVNDVLRLVVAPCRSRMLQTAISAARHAVRFYQFYYSPNGRRIEPIPRAAHRNGSRHSTARRCGDYQGCGHRTYGRIHGSLDHCALPQSLSIRRYTRGASWSNYMAEPAGLIMEETLSPSTYDPRVPVSTTVDTITAVGGGAHIHRRISWAAIFGGVILVVAVQLLLSLLGAGFGLGTVNTNAGSTPTATTLGIGAGLWWVISSCVALGVGGFVAAWLAGIEIRFDGVLHGLVTWGIATLLTLWLLTSAIGGIISGGFSALSSVASAAGSGVSDVAKPLAQAAGVSPDMIQQQAQAYLQPTNPDPATMSPQDAQKAIATDLVTYAGGGADAAAAKEHIVNVMAAQMKISHDEAAKKFDDAQSKLKQTRDKAVQSAKDTADASAAAASKTSFAAFVVVLLGALAAALGGSIAVQRRLVVSHRTVNTGPA